MTMKICPAKRCVQVMALKQMFKITLLKFPTLNTRHARTANPVATYLRLKIRNLFFPTRHDQPTDPSDNKCRHCQR